jgi:4-hydroxybenzoate polyprenyltransferase
VLAVLACYGTFFAMMAGIGSWQGYGPFYFAGLLAGGIVALFHLHWIRDRSREGCFRAFLHNHWIGLAVFAGVLLDALPPGTGAG